MQGLGPKALFHLGSKKGFDKPAPNLYLFLENAGFSPGFSYKNGIEYK